MPTRRSIPFPFVGVSDMPENLWKAYQAMAGRWWATPLDPPSVTATAKSGPGSTGRGRDVVRAAYARLLTEPVGLSLRRSRRAERSPASSLSRRTISMVFRISGSLESLPIVDAIARNRALNFW